MSSKDFVHIGSLKGVSEFRQALASLSIELPCDDDVQTADTSALARPSVVMGRRLGNRFCIQPMEGWDGLPDGRPSDLTFRRWRRFGASGAELIWGCEAVAVRRDGRANPNQLVLNESTQSDIARLREALLAAHRSATGSRNDILVGLQLTHSGRFSRPSRQDRAEPVIAYHHPLLDRRVGIDSDHPPITDGEIRRLIVDFAAAARRARDCGFDFVDLKHCHGYLGHELLGAHTRPGDFGGSFQNRTRFLRELVQAVRTEAPSIGLAVRLSAFDCVPFEPDPARSQPGKLGPGVPCGYCDCLPYVYGFGIDQEQPTEMELTEPHRFLDLLVELGIPLVNITAGSPYYSHHIQRPALYPPCDGYQPPEDPLVGVARQMYVTRSLKQSHPELTVVGTAYTYLQEYLPNVAQAAVREGWTDFVGLGRMVLAYPELPLDVLSGRPLRKKSLCRTFSDCTTAPRSGLVSGCYPLDTAYRESEAAGRLALAKDALRKRLGG